MISVKGGFSGEIKSFVNNHKRLCVLTLGLAVVGYSLGNLAGRVISWISECWETTKKTDTVAYEVISAKESNFNNPSDSNSINTLQIDQSLLKQITPTSNVYIPKNIHLKKEQTLNLSESENEDPGELSPSAYKLLTAYNNPQEGWVIVPPKGEIAAEQPFVIGSGAIGFDGNGRWKVHVSIDPNQMEQAIPIIIDVLHGNQAPRLGFKMQTSANLNSVHQIGKELAIIFDGQEEEATFNNQSTAIQDCLSLLWNKLYAAGIRPEPGYVLTPDTIKYIKNAPKGSQLREKENLEAGKFDRAIPCPKECNFFYYRDENFAPMRDDSIGNLRGTPGVYAASDIVKLARTTPDLAHNPTRSPDPFLRIRIQKQ